MSPNLDFHDNHFHADRRIAEAGRRAEPTFQNIQSIPRLYARSGKKSLEPYHDRISIEDNVPLR